MSDRIGTGATLSIGHKGAIHATALAAGRRSSSFAPPPLRPSFCSQRRPVRVVRRSPVNGHDFDLIMVTQQVMTRFPAHCRSAYFAGAVVWTCGAALS